MFTNSISAKFYNTLMEDHKKLCHRLHLTLSGEAYQQGIRLKKLKNALHGGINETTVLLSKQIKNRAGKNELARQLKLFTRENNPISKPNYFSTERIAVYTCIFGKYDSISDPLCHPDNIDYYIITDQPLPEGSVWKKLDITPWNKLLENYSNVEKNRWFKIHPHLVFTHYRYSIYIDGNVIPVTDFTEFVNRITRPGIAMFWHKYNNCVYQEGLYNRYIVKKISDNELQKHMDYLKSEGMPTDYGMTTCNVIARDHENKLCIKIMDDWWLEFMGHCRRDQMSFPFVVWKNKVAMEEIARLGNDVWETDTLLVVPHE